MQHSLCAARRSFGTSCGYILKLVGFVQLFAIWNVDSVSELYIGLEILLAVSARNRELTWSAALMRRKKIGLISPCCSYTRFLYCRRGVTLENSMSHCFRKQTKALKWETVSPQTDSGVQDCEIHKFPDVRTAPGKAVDVTR